MTAENLQNHCSFFMHFLTAIDTANPTQIIEIKASKCRCGGRFKYTEKMYSRKQLVDIEIKTNVTEYREYTGICECCGSKSANRSPLTDRITYGSNIKSLCNMLSVEGNVSTNRISQIVRSCIQGKNML